METITNPSLSMFGLGNPNSHYKCVFGWFKFSFEVCFDVVWFWLEIYGGK